MSEYINYTGIWWIDILLFIIISLIGGVIGGVIMIGFMKLFRGRGI